MPDELRHVERERAVRADHVERERDHHAGDPERDQVDHEEQHVLPAQAGAGPVREGPVPVGEVGDRGGDAGGDDVRGRRAEPDAEVHQVEQADVDEEVDDADDPECRDLLEQHPPGRAETVEQRHRRSVRGPRAAPRGGTACVSAAARGDTIGACPTSTLSRKTSAAPSPTSPVRSSRRWRTATTSGPSSRTRWSSRWRELGLFGLPFPEEYGGMGGDYLSLCLAIEELARVDSSVAITLEAGGVARRDAGLPVRHRGAEAGVAAAAVQRARRWARSG